MSFLESSLKQTRTKILNYTILFFIFLFLSVWNNYSNLFWQVKRKPLSGLTFNAGCEQLNHKF